MGRRLRFWASEGRPILLFLFLIGLLTSVQAQRESSIAGIVADPFGAPVPQVRIELSDVSNGEQRSTTFSDSEGRFLFAKVPDGRYLLRIRLVEYSTERTIEIKNGKALELRIELFKGCEDQEHIKGTISETDLIDIVNRALGYGLRKLSNASEETSEKVIVSLSNIRRNWISPLIASRTRVLSKAGIRQKANKDGDFEYLEISRISKKGGCVLVDVRYSWAKGENSNVVYLSGEGVTLQYTKPADKLLEKVVSGWVS